MADDAIAYPFSSGYTPGNIDLFEKADSLTEKEREKYIDRLEQFGLIPTSEKSALRELWNSSAQSAVKMVRGMGSTAEEMGLGSGLKEWGEEVLARNQQWNEPENLSAAGYVARAIGTGVGSTAPLVPAMAADALFGTKGVATFATVFSQSFGDNFKRNRELYGAGSENAAAGMAAVESAVDAGIELLLGTVPMMGKTLKGLTYAGKRELAKGVYKQAVKQLGRSKAQRFFLGMARNGAEEAGEEGLQYINEWMFRAYAGDPENEFSIKQMADNMAQGAIGGLALGMLGGGHDASIFQNKNGKVRPWLVRDLQQEGKITPETADQLLGKEVDPDKTEGRTFVEALYDELGIPHSRTEEGMKGVTQDGQTGDANGFFDKNTNEIKINPNNEGEVLTHGHELNHWMTKNHPDLAKQVQEVMDAEFNEAGEAEQGGRNRQELYGDMLGRILKDPDEATRIAQRGDELHAGFGEKFLKALHEFAKKMMAWAKAHAELKGAEQYFKDYKRVKDVVADAMVELRRRNGTSTQAENVKGANGSTAVQSVPVSELNVDPARFQFKSNTNPVTGVDENSPISGEWDPKTAGNLYVWEDRTGKKFVVNGHHRFALAKEKGVKELNAIIDREADGITAEQAKRQGTLINIRDGQGDVEDYAEFVRNEKMDEETAMKEGFFKREGDQNKKVRGREKALTGFTIGRYAGDNLYSAFRNGDIPADKAALIADIARGDSAIENAGLRAAQNRMPAEQLTEFLKLLKNTPRKQATGEVQDDLFGFDDSAIRTAETLSKLATKKIREINAKIRAAEGAVKNPEGARKLGVTTKANAEKLLNAAKEEKARWEHWHTDPELYQQLMKEAGLAEEAAPAPAPAPAPESAPEPAEPTQETTQENTPPTQENTPPTQETEGGLFEAPAAEPEAPAEVPESKTKEETPPWQGQYVVRQRSDGKWEVFHKPVPTIDFELIASIHPYDTEEEARQAIPQLHADFKKTELEMRARKETPTQAAPQEESPAPGSSDTTQDTTPGEQEAEPAPAPETAEKKNAPTPPDQVDLQQALREVIEVDVDGRVKQQRLLRLAKQFGLTEKEIQERCEGEVVNLAREINAREDLSDDQKFEALLQLYDKQPNFSKRTSTSVLNQAYSTPAPLAWTLGKRIGLEGRSVYEPTAGTGMLTIAGNPATIDVNEIDVVRKNILSGQGFRRLTDKDASKNRPNRTYDRVIMNPPFDTAEKTDFDGYALSKLDHIIAARALETLAPNGRAAIIVGANTEHRDGSGRTDYPDFVFMGYLYSHFNVADNFIVSGDLYKKQGASPPVRVITINGRKTDTKNAVEVPKRFEILGNWDTLYEKLKGELQNEVSEPGRSVDEYAVSGAGQEEQSAADNGRRASGDQGSLGADRGRAERGSRSAEGSGVLDEQQPGRGGSLGTDQSQGRQLSRPAESVSDNSGRVGAGSGNLARQTSGTGNQTETVADSGRSGGAGSESALRTGGQSQQSVVSSPRIQVGKRRGELNNTYLPASKSKDHMDVVVPRFMAEAVENSLNHIAGQVGDVDRFVQNELGYGTPDELYSALSDVQIDGVAQAITAIRNGDGFVLGDQTGIGKGRQCAAMIRWAQHQGITPIFCTKDQNLFTDMYRDGKDIGNTFNPLIVASNADMADITDQNGKKIVRIPKNQAKAFKEMLAGESSYDCIFVPYSQLQKTNNQQAFLRQLVTSRKCLLIMDEAHEASGDSARGRFFYGTGGLLRQNDVGVIYASATFAKRPDNMALYFRTNIRKAVDSIDNLKEILAKGGVPLQQLLSSGLAQDGQYTRRERDFTGVKFDTVVAEPQGGNGEISAKQELIDKYDRVADVLGKLVDHSERVKKAVNKAERDNYGTANTREKSSIQTASFASVTHNYIAQLLLATKCDIIVDEAEKAFKAGQKPVIALTNTLESVLQDFVESAGITQGDPMTMKFSDILESALNRMYSYTQKLGKGDNKVRVTFSPEKYGLTGAHERMLEAIHDLDDLDLPVSPIDYIKQQLEKRGIRTGEITGRKLTVDYSGPVPVLANRGAQEQNKNRNVNAFNSGETDAIILNKSGSTGLSLHASAKFADQKQRHMIMVQPDLDIAIVQQMFGRVLRSGQVNSPTYTILSSPLAAERRPMMVLGRKLQSLNANTTANNKGSVTLGLDFMNKYGDVVAQQYLNDNPEVAALLDLETDSSGEEVTSAKEDLMVKLTGRMAVLPDHTQQEILDDLTARYTDMVDFLKKTGNYDLEITVHDDWDAKTIEEDEVVSGAEDGSIFQQPVTLKKINIKEQRNIREAAEVRGEIDSNLGSTRNELDEKLNEDFARAERAIDNLEKTYAENEAEPEFIQNRKILLRRKMNEFKRFIRDNYRMPLELTIGEDSYSGVVTGYRITGKFNPRSPIIDSKLMIDVAVSDTIGKITIPFSRFQKKDVTVSGSIQTLNDLFTGEKRAVRSDRYAITGNLLRGLEYAEAGKVVSYKTAEGRVETALLMPKLWAPANMVRDPRNEIHSVEEALEQLNGPGIIRSGDGLAVVRRYGNTYISAPKAKRQGGKYFLDKGLLAITGDFTSYGQVMRTGSLDEAQTKRALAYILGMEDTFLKKDNLAGRQYSIQQKTREMTTEEVKKLPSVSFEELSQMVPIVGTPAPTFDKVGALKKYIKSVIPPEKRKPVNHQTQWPVRISGHSFDEIVNHPGRRPYVLARMGTFKVLPELIEIAKFHHFADNFHGKTGEFFYFDAPYRFEQTDYVARLAFKRVLEPDGEFALHYDHDLSTLEEWKAVSEKESTVTGERPTAKASPTVMDSSINIPPNPENSSPETEKNGKIFSLKRRRQVNPIREPGPIRDEYQERLDNSTYTPRSNDEVNRLAARRIANLGGMAEAARMVADGELTGTTDVGQRVMQLVLNSPEVKAMDVDERARISDRYEKIAGTETARALAARRLGALKLDDITSVQAHINALMFKLDKIKPKNTLREDILKEFEVDIDALPDDIVSDPEKLDALVRKLAAQRAKVRDKLYEFWINSILSGPTTHGANTLGNVSNAVYELGLKRFAEAAVNLAAGRKDGATFGEFQAMTKFLNWKNAWRRAQFAFNYETLNLNAGKLDVVRTAIGGKAGQLIRTPGRLLRAADEFAKAVIQPMETAAYAYREGKANGLSGAALQQYITDQMTDENSAANDFGNRRALELTFQTEPGTAVKQLIQWREAGGVFGTLLKFTLPFIKTPANILEQGIRKSPLGAASLAWETGKLALGKRKFDGEYVSRVAEQLIAWGAVALLMGMGDDDDDDLPFLTGSSAAYGSPEANFKANKVPPYSIRIGGNYYSYQRIEPLSTGLAFIADGINAFRAAKRGEDGTRVMKKLMAGMKQLIVEKSFLDSLGEINRVASDPERSLAKFITNYLGSWMPNVVRQTAQAFDDTVRDSKSRARGTEFWEDQFRIIAGRSGLYRGAPKLDYFGREIKKDSLADAGPLGVLGRLVPIRSIPAGDMNRAERLMWNWNRENPDHEYYPSVPAYWSVRNGRKLYFSGDNYQELARESGQLALKQIENAFRHGLLNEERPREKDIKLIKSVFTKARKVVRDRMIREGRFSE